MGYAAKIKKTIYTVATNWSLRYSVNDIIRGWKPITNNIMKELSKMKARKNAQDITIMINEVLTKDDKHDEAIKLIRACVAHNLRAELSLELHEVQAQIDKTVDLMRVNALKVQLQYITDEYTALYGDGTPNHILAELWKTTYPTLSDYDRNIITAYAGQYVGVTPCLNTNEAHKVFSDEKSKEADKKKALGKILYFFGRNYQSDIFNQMKFSPNTPEVKAFEKIILQGYKMDKHTGIVNLRNMSKGGFLRQVTAYFVHRLQIADSTDFLAEHIMDEAECLTYAHDYKAPKEDKKAKKSVEKPDKK